MDTQIKGIHHVTAMTSSPTKIYRFFTDILGMRLVKKTINQDDIETYHLYFTDEYGSPGTDMTFFAFPNQPQGSKGTDTISRVSFRVPTDEALTYWFKRFEEKNVPHSAIKERFSKKYLEFEDFDHQFYQLISDENNTGVASGTPWKNSNIPSEYTITGLGPVFVRVSQMEPLQLLLEQTLAFKLTDQTGAFSLFEVGQGGNGASIIVEQRADLLKAIEGFGNIHHLALRVADEEALRHWIHVINQINVPSSGFVDRFYFQSEYFLAATHVLFELATDGPGFFGDESADTAGEKLSLPPQLESKREEIEAYIRPFDTQDANQQRE